ncbi:MAG: iron-sulfur cluster assembly accessory protein [Flammeovirgaceae bacterium]|jgi:iron-sulfur cluster assembly protein|nr:iron-sulfur cluster assembly accessory protein [Flammeovirgaceae bacterium]
MFDNLQPVTITPRAAQEVMSIMRTKGIPDGYAPRLGVKGGGCGGVSLIIGFDKQKPNDLSYQIDGVTVLVDKKHTMYLIGKKVDFYEGADAKGFMFVEMP